MIKKIVLAGGPCAGKSTALQMIPPRLPLWNFITVPESASIVLAENDNKHCKETQDKIFKLKIHSELMAFRKALCSPQEHNIILYDRGVLDGLVYQKNTYDQRLAEYDMTRQDAIDRYDHVIYMYSAARGAAKHYSRKKNRNRTESIDRAVHICQKTEEAWSNHPSVFIVDNSTDFKGKIDKAVWSIVQEMAK